MTPAERIHAAIQKLEALKSASTTGPWRKEYILGGGNDLLYAIIPHSMVPVIGSTLAEADHDLIVTLHRTIDAQLLLLRTEANRHDHTIRIPNPLPEALSRGYGPDELNAWQATLTPEQRNNLRPPIDPNTLALADSILGTTP